MTTSNHGRELTHRMDGLIADELEHVSGGKPNAAPKDPPVQYLTFKLETAMISGYSL